MIGLDTNVLVRYLVRDDPAQTARADRLIESRCTPEHPGRIAIVTLCELYWVLRRGYGYRQSDILRVVRGLLSAADLDLENPALVWSALQTCERGKAGFADYVIAQSNALAGAKPTFTFDATAATDPWFAPEP
jgi:predicted nucleic-acid-binding protein